MLGELLNDLALFVKLGLVPNALDLVDILDGCEILVRILTEPRMLKSLLCSNSLVSVLAEHPHDEVLSW